MQTEIYPHVSPSLNPANISDIEGYDNCAGLCATPMAVLKTICENFSGLHDGRSELKGNALISNEEAIVKLDEIGSKHLAKAHTQIYSCREALQTQIQSFTTELSKPLVQQASAGIINQEIRSHYKQLTDTERRTQLMGAINSGDQKTVAAVLGAPPYLSGLNNEDQKNYTLSFHKKNNPVTYGRLKTMTKVLEIMEHRHTLLQPEYDKAIGADPAKVNFLRSEKAKANAAFAAAQ